MTSLPQLTLKDHANNGHQATSPVSYCCNYSPKSHVAHDGCGSKHPPTSTPCVKQKNKTPYPRMKITLTYHDVHKFRRIDQIPLNTISLILIETIRFEPITHPLHNDYTLNHQTNPTIDDFCLI